MIFDTHAHYDDEAFDEDRGQLLSSLREQGISLVVNVGADMSSSQATISLTKEYPFIYGAVGVHPENVAEVTRENLTTLAALATEDKVVAIGEIGLDYYWNSENKEAQKQAFYDQLALALRLDLPVIVHSREAAADTLDIVTEVYHQSGGKLTGVIHCFSYSVEMANEFLKLGFFIGLGGVVTFQNAKKPREVAQSIPLDRLVLETDCPYLAPVPNRGKRNNSQYLNQVAEQIAALRGISKEELCRATTENAKRLYRMA